MNAQIARRLFVAFLVAVLLGIAAATITAQDEDTGKQPIYYPGICLALEPYGYWYYFFDCHNAMDAAAETVTVTEADGHRTTRIERTYRDGSRRVLVLRQPLKRR